MNNTLLKDNPNENHLDFVGQPGDLLYKTLVECRVVADTLRSDSDVKTWL
jgi:hypothetical protein